MIRFGHPAVLGLTLLVIPLLVVFLIWAGRTKQALVCRIISNRLLSRLLVDVSITRQKIRLALLASAVACALLALARPQWGFAWEEAKQRGLDIVAAIDTSRSMLAEDIQPNRLERAKLEALSLLDRARTDRLGLVPFAGTAFLQCPLTLDDEAFRQSVLELNPRIMPQGGSRLGEAIATALTAFKDETENHKVLILFSDGEDHDSDAVAAAAEGAKAGLRIFTIGVGTPEGELLRTPDASGTQGFIKDNADNVIKSRLNETLLRQIATVGNGFYLNLRGADTMDTLYERGLEPLPKGDISSKFVRRYKERFYLPLGLAIVLLLVEYVMPDRSRMRRSAKPGTAPVSASIRQVATILLLLGVPGLAAASPASARRDFEHGRYDKSLREYERLLARRPEDSRLQYNTGSAAYQSGRFDQAFTNLSSALTASDLTLQQRAFYNLGNTLYRLGEHAPDSTTTKQHWEQALKAYEAALGLEARDEDARFNHEFLKKRLEQLAQQQAAQQPRQSSGGQSNDAQNDPAGDRKKADQQSANQNSPSPRQQAETQQKDAPDPSAQKGGQQQQPESQPERKAEPPRPDPKSAPSAKEEPAKQPDERGTGSAEAGQAAVSLGQLTLQQALQLLDAQRGDERTFVFGPLNLPTNQVARPVKDW